MLEPNAEDRNGDGSAAAALPSFVGGPGWDLIMGA